MTAAVDRRFHCRSIGMLGFTVASTVWLVVLAGCQPSDSTDPSGHPYTQLPALRALQHQGGAVVVARGRLQPAGGTIAVRGPAGDRLVRLDVAEGARVERGATLGELESLRLRQAELAVANAQLAEAKAQSATEINLARAKLELRKVGLKQAEQALSQAKSKFDRARRDDGQLGLLRRQVELASKQLDRLYKASSDPATDQLVTTTAIDQQRLLVSQYQAELDAARAEAQQRIEAGELAVEVANKEIEAAKLTLQAAEASAARDSLQRQAELLQARVDSSQLVSPIGGKVVSVEIAAGETTTGGPIMFVADTSQMVCRAEVNVAEISRIKVGAAAKISGPALPRPLSGTVESISQLIGSPTLDSADPLARVDWRSTMVVITIDADDNGVASRLINLQVDVAIEAEARRLDSELSSPADPST